MAAPTEDQLAKNLELIHQLLNKAANTPYPAEAQTFQEHAERLMIRYGIDKAQVDAEAGKQGKPREKMTERHYVVTGSYQDAISRGLIQIGNAFETVSVLQAKDHRSRTTVLYLVGAESDVDQIMRQFESITMQCEVALKSWWASLDYKQYIGKHDKERERREFRLAFLFTVAARIKVIYGEESTGQELVLADRKGRAEEHTHTLYPGVKPVTLRSLNSGSKWARYAGQEAGERADVSSGHIETKTNEGAALVAAGRN